jgi:hypothetical protein
VCDRLSAVNVRELCSGLETAVQMEALLIFILLVTEANSVPVERSARKKS